MNDFYADIRSLVAEGFERFDFDEFLRQVDADPATPVMFREWMNRLVVDENTRQLFHAQMALLYAVQAMAQQELDDHIQKYHRGAKP